MKRNDAISRFQQILLRRREALRRSLGSELTLLGQHDDDDELCGDGILSQLAECESHELEAIDHALERMRNGQYGSCEECGGKIPLSRLQALPYASLCINCQRQTEKLRRKQDTASNWSGVVESNEDDQWAWRNAELLLQ